MRLTCGFWVFLQVQLHKRTDRHNFKLMEVSVVKRSANQLAAQAARTHRLRNLSVDQPHGVTRALVLEKSSSLVQRDLKLTIGFIVLDGIAIHDSLPVSNTVFKRILRE